MTVEELIKNTDTLPPAPEVLPKLVKIMKDPDTDASDIVQLISTDAAIMAGVLKLTNSGAYSPASPVTDLQDAVAMLGIKEVYRIVNLVSSGDYLDGALPSMDIGKGSLWAHSLAVALIMDQIAKEATDMEGLPYTLGLLHDIGKLGMHLGCGEQYVNIFKKVETERLSLDKAESQTLGFDHALAGSKMLEEWSFPEEVYIPIRYQYNPTEAPEEHRKLAGALHVANWGAAVIGCNDGRDSWALDMIEGAFEIDQSQLELAILNAREKLEKARHALEVGAN
ncbi:HDOD domain-containing protein [Pelagicoccus sp. SDUM812002]|uniref:HDOD domain-containing protein n=1 Tax=Pelagicoccus sp. SDUM812002 TaxID=3041266 RepID=UPI00280C7352|nr:HDOD domain-containing protein [Pelagicoccus sp. SDUM812002]MDQ8186448.1 HDOD domain-containing protein [Pelagicoccus sp. SDUM812002]